MNDATPRRRIAALVIATLMAVSGAAVMAGSFAADDAHAINGGFVIEE